MLRGVSIIWGGPILKKELTFTFVFEAAEDGGYTVRGCAMLDYERVRHDDKWTLADICIFCRANVFKPIWVDEKLCCPICKRPLRY